MKILTEKNVKYKMKKTKVEQKKEILQMIKLNYKKSITIYINQSITNNQYKNNKEIE